MITTTSLKHPVIREKLMQAMDLALQGRGEEMNGHGNRCYVQNRKGRNVMRVNWIESEKDWIVYGSESRNITDAVLTAVFL